MRHRPLIGLAAAMLALTACNQSSPPAQSAEAGRNDAAPAAAARNAASEAAPSNSLWGVTEEDDAASHRGMDFIAFNRTGRTVTAVALKPDEGPLGPGVADTPWSDSVLAQDELPDGQRAAAHYEPDIEICRWQVQATFSDGSKRDYPGVNLCETIRVDLR